MAFAFHAAILPEYDIIYDTLSISPSAKAPMGVFPVAVTRWQISPRRPGAQNPEHRIDELPVIARDASPLAALTR
jgi:hypothetical protein